MTTKRILLGGLILALCCTAAGAAVIVPTRLVPPISKQLPADAAHLYVQMVSPMRESHWPLNAFIPILVQAQAAEQIKQVDVFINGTALQAQAGFGKSFSSIWRWQPGVTGDFILTARATGKSGLSGVSSPLLIHVTAAAHTVSPVTVKAGDTLESIAAAQNVPVEELQQENPDLGPDIDLQAGSNVYVPNDPDPVTNEDIIDPLPEGGSEPGGGSQTGGNEQPGGDQGSGASSKGPTFLGPSTNFFDDMQFLWETNPPVPVGGGSGPKYPPATPVLFGDFKGCDVNIRFATIAFEDSDPKSGWMGWEEDGFFVYRSRDGGPSERIATLPPVHATAVAGQVQFADAGEFGTLTYEVSAFNALGEAHSNPLTFALNPGVCPPTDAASANSIRMDANGDILLPFSMDMAYLYVQINGSAGIRVPEGTRMFLPHSGIRFNLYDYLGTLSDSLQLPDLKLHMEVWGWQGGNLVFAGLFDTELHRTVLTICSLPGAGACSSGGGNWVTTLTLPHDPPLADLVYEMRWQVTSLTNATNLVITVSELPVQQDFSAVGLLYHGSLEQYVDNPMYNDIKGNDGVFTLDLGNILYPDPPPKTLGWDNTPSRLTEYRSMGYSEEPLGQPFQLYVHVYPQLGMDGYEHESNLVTLLYDTTAEPVGMPPLASPYPSLYTLDILEEQFKPASHYDEDSPLGDKWGCVVIDEDPTGKYTPGTEVCPGKDAAEAYYHQDDCGDTPEWLCLLEGLGNAFGFVYDTMVTGINAMKTAIAEGLAAIIPGCSDSPGCQDVMNSAVDYGAAYLTGLPPDLPSSEELVADSIADQIITLAEQYAESATGADAEVLNKICEGAADCKEKLSASIETRLKQARSLASQAACNNAYFAYFHGQAPACLDPSIIVHPAMGSIDSPAVALVRITRNDTPAPEGVGVVNAVAIDVSASGAGTEVDPFLKSNQSPLPALDPGESIVVPVKLDSLYKESQVAGGVAHITAREMCYSPGSTWDWVPCENGGTDQADAKLP